MGNRTYDQIDPFEAYGRWIIKERIEVPYDRMFWKHEKLMNELHKIPFIYLIPRDANRDEDGLSLRREYADLLRLYRIPFEGMPASVLEVMAAIAIRVDGEYIGNPHDERPDLFLYEMVKNLGLLVFDDRNFNSESVHKIINTWLYREFRSDGLGSPFPIQNDTRDQREFEIWDQMNHYIFENYRNL